MSLAQECADASTLVCRCDLRDAGFTRPPACKPWQMPGQTNIPNEPGAFPQTAPQAKSGIWAAANCSDSGGVVSEWCGAKTTSDRSCEIGRKGKTKVDAVKLDDCSRLVSNRHRFSAISVVSSSHECPGCGNCSAAGLMHMSATYATFPRFRVAPKAHRNCGNSIANAHYHRAGPS